MSLAAAADADALSLAEMSELALERMDMANETTGVGGKGNRDGWQMDNKGLFLGGALGDAFDCGMDDDEIMGAGMEVKRGALGPGGDSGTAQLERQRSERRAPTLSFDAAAGFGLEGKAAARPRAGSYSHDSVSPGTRGLGATGAAHVPMLKKPASTSPRPTQAAAAAGAGGEDWAAFGSPGAGSGGGDGGAGGAEAAADEEDENEWTFAAAASDSGSAPSPTPAPAPGGASPAAAAEPLALLTVVASTDAGSVVVSAGGRADSNSPSVAARTQPAVLPAPSASPPPSSSSSSGSSSSSSSSSPGSSSSGSSDDEPEPRTASSKQATGLFVAAAEGAAVDMRASETGGAAAAGAAAAAAAAAAAGGGGGGEEAGGGGGEGHLPSF
jgi:hypothetical protein